MRAPLHLPPMKILRTTLFAAAIVLAACTARASEKEEGFSALTVDQVSDLIAKKDADVFDNNSKDEWKDGHVPTASTTGGAAPSPNPPSATVVNPSPSPCRGTVLARWPLRELPPLRPAGSFLE